MSIETQFLDIALSYIHRERNLTLLHNLLDVAWESALKFKATFPKTNDSPLPDPKAQK